MYKATDNTKIGVFPFGLCNIEAHWTGNSVLKTPKGDIQLNVTPDQLREFARQLENIEFQTALANKISVGVDTDHDDEDDRVSPMSSNKCDEVDHDEDDYPFNMVWPR